MSFTLVWEESLLQILGLTSEEVFQIADSANELYSSILIEKSTKKRKIYIPNNKLKVLQRLVLHSYLKEEYAHPQVFSYISGSSLLSHVEQHKAYLFTLKIDLSNFFESIPCDVVFKYFIGRYPANVADFLTKITCKDGVLPLGAPSSPMLSNLILRKLDEYWNSFAEDNLAEYTRYSDDIYISANNSEFLLSILPQFHSYIEAHFPYLSINKKKTHLLSSNNRRITGLVITQDGRITIGRQRKRILRVLLDKYSKNTLDDKQIQSLRGTLIFTQGHDESYFISLQSKYSQEIKEIYAGSENTIDSDLIESTSLMPPNIKTTQQSGHSTLLEKENLIPQPLRISQSLKLIEKYLELGWQVLPCYSVNGLTCTCGKEGCRRAGKHPSVKHGVYDATSDLSELIPWIDKGCNVAIATGLVSKIVVLDIDINKGGYASYQKLLKFINEEMFNTLQCKTGSGGIHFYFSYPAVSLKNRIGVLPGIDFKTDGGYIIAPPSLHISGDLYTWIDVEKLDHNSIKPLPESLIEVLKE